MRAPKWTGALLALARVHLCHRDLESGMATQRGHATLKVAIEKLQSCERQEGTGLEQRRQRFQLGAAGEATRTLTRLLPRASRLNDRCTVVDTVSNATRTPPRVPLRARAEKSPHSSVSLAQNGMWHVAPDGAELRAMGRV